MSTPTGDELAPSPADSDPSGCPSGCDERELLRDEEFFMDGYFVTFEVNNRLFRVPSYQFFNESPDFVEVYNLSAHVEDNSDPIKLEVEHFDFCNFLRILYPLSVALQLRFTKEEWISILTLASEWKFLRLRELAKVELEKLSLLDSVEQVSLGRQLKISRWVSQGLTRLVERDETISDDEAIDIDIGVVATSYKLFRLRELKIAGRLTSAMSKVNALFHQELEQIQSDERHFDDEEIIKMKAERDLEKLKQEEEEMRKKEQEELEEQKKIEQEEAAREKETRLREEAERLTTLRYNLGGKKKSKKK